MTTNIEHQFSLSHVIPLVDIILVEKRASVDTCENSFVLKLQKVAKHIPQFHVFVISVLAVVKKAFSMITHATNNSIYDFARYHVIYNI